MGKIVLVCLFFIQSVAWSDPCPRKVAPIKQGDVAPCSGFLFSDEAEKEAAKARDDVIHYKNINSLLERKVDFLVKENDTASERLQNFIMQNRELSKQVVRQESYTDIQKFVYFTLGVVATSVIVSNVNK